MRVKTSKNRIDQFPHTHTNVFITFQLFIKICDICNQFKILLVLLLIITPKDWLSLGELAVKPFLSSLNAIQVFP